MPTPGDVIAILAFLADAIARIQDQIARQEKREKIKDEIACVLLHIMDFVVDAWLDLSADKAVEGGYGDFTDEIEDTLNEIRSLLHEAYRAASANDLATAADKLAQLERQRRQLIQLVRRLRRRQRQAARASIPQGANTGRLSPGFPG
jgi:tRNA uridine 5-carbamoylmethylation protein Kti12